MRPILLSTVGTSLFGNLARLPEGKYPDLAAASAAKDDSGIAQALAALSPEERVCGAEINSIASLVRRGAIPKDAGLYFFHSATDDGRRIAAILCDVFRRHGHDPVRPVEIADLQDADPDRFRTHGLRNLARALCQVIRDHSPGACAINATGGYKAQVAIGVLLGQAIGVPVYYKHEQFDAIIAFPPLPVSLDFEVWMRASGFLEVLEREDTIPAESVADDDWDEKFESLVERVTIDGQDYLTLSAAGLIFHETFRDRFRSECDQMLPPPALAGQKERPVGEDGRFPCGKAFERFLEELTRDVPFVVQCRTKYYNPRLPQPIHFKMSQGEVLGIWSDGSQTCKFVVKTTATTDGQRNAACAALTEWLRRR